MFTTEDLNHLAQKILDTLPPSVRELRSEVEKNLHSVLQSTFAKLDLITREEFDVQTKVLSRTREKLEQLEHAVEQLTPAAKKTKLKKSE